jgi:hypothetical protein
MANAVIFVCFGLKTTAKGLQRMMHLPQFGKIVEYLLFSSRYIIEIDEDNNQ